MKKSQIQTFSPTTFLMTRAFDEDIEKYLISFYLFSIF
jgi:hypothetical protein